MNIVFLCVANKGRKDNKASKGDSNIINILLITTTKLLKIIIYYDYINMLMTVAVISLLPLPLINVEYEFKCS